MNGETIAKAPRVLYEDADLLVLDKPAGLLMHGDRHHQGEPTLLAWALEYLSGFVSDFTPAFVHRLDKDTSGVAVLAKSKRALRSLNRQLKLKKIRKEYRALVVGETRLRGSIRLHLQKQMDRARWLALMVPVRRGGIYAQTDYERLALCEHGGVKLSYVQAQPRTGRTHQLRAHFAAVGCPIVGDDLYGNPDLNRRLHHELGVTRMLLHAFALEFAHPETERTVRVEAPLPDDFQHVLRQLTPADPHRRVL
ncbi:MAG: RluA family pseudouridine synthase [Candidatus Bipolaricaulota bacterium]|nr:RluA family pseudouridine synthase [Candidatus Bipolaricaulota bacterium]MCS7274729.1 RluA family pseudouridine synthase [Candidatus Bipolaricaulota bacterium]MDW8110008.1 RluA family pseudouridine synthase [Candidatus Bipolaricaulota bacterium]MDW8328920.1 RluA family pseudouridine synthase [Candidatus Bipolaricaulota bacterium]